VRVPDYRVLNQGSGIYNGAGSSLTLDRDRVFGDEVSAPTSLMGTDAQGGGVYNATDATDDCGGERQQHADLHGQWK
jgi:hypothetical protein